MVSQKLIYTSFKIIIIQFINKLPNPLIPLESDQFEMSVEV